MTLSLSVRSPDRRQKKICKTIYEHWSHHADHKKSTCIQMATDQTLITPRRVHHLPASSSIRSIRIFRFLSLHTAKCIPAVPNFFKFYYWNLQQMHFWQMQTKTMQITYLVFCVCLFSLGYCSAGQIRHSAPSCRQTNVNIATCTHPENVNRNVYAVVDQVPPK